MAFSIFNSISSNLTKPKINAITPYLMIATGGGSAVGNSMVSSYDGYAWNAYGTSPPYYFPFPSQQISAFATNGTILLLGASSGLNTICYSQDNGITWIGCGLNILSTSCRGITYNPNSNMFVATGSGTYRCAYSYDGINWTGGNNTTVLFTIGYCVDYIGTNWIVGGASGALGYLGYSSDGINWTLIGRPFLNAGIYGIASCRENTNSGVKWVAVGDSKDATTPTVMYSTDLSGSLNSWTAAYMGGVQVYTTLIAPPCNALVYNGSVWIVGGAAVSGNNIAKSTDGQNWTQASVLAGGNVNAIASNGSNIVAVSPGSTLITSTNIVVSIDNGNTWIQRGFIQNTQGPGGGPMAAVCWFKNSFIIGSNVTAYRAPGQYVLISLSEPINTSPIVGLAKGQADKVYGVAKYGNIIVVCGSFGLSTSINNGITWSSIMTTTYTFNTVYWSNAFNAFIACPSTASVGIYTSPDGLTWTLVTIANIGVVRRMAISDPSLNSAATRTIVLVTGPSNLIYTSTDLVTWNTKSTPINGITFGTMQSVCWAPSLNMFVATGAGTAPNLIVSSSDNGVTWINRNSLLLVSPGYSVAWSPSQTIFVAGCNGNKLVWSSDGVTWNNCTGTISSTQVSDIIWNASLNKWFGVGISNLIITSSDGKTWTTVTQTIFKSNNSSIQVFPV